MHNKKIAFTLIVLSVALFISLAITSQRFSLSKHDLPTTFNHITIGIIFSLFSFGIYFLIFENSEQKLLLHLEQEKQKQLRQEKLKLIRLGMTQDEQGVFTAIVEQPGISQHTLSLRTDLHKSKLSILLKQLEEKNLITKTRKGRVNHIHLKISL